MENSDLTAIVKELMAIFAPKKEESQKFERQIDTPKSPKTDEGGQNFPYEKEASPGAVPPSSANPFAPQTSPEQRYQNFLLRHEEQKRKMQKGALQLLLTHFFDYSFTNIAVSSFSSEAISLF